MYIVVFFFLQQVTTNYHNKLKCTADNPKFWLPEQKYITNLTCEL